jgi:hypothetical protein
MRPGISHVTPGFACMTAPIGTGCVAVVTSSLPVQAGSVLVSGALAAGCPDVIRRDVMRARAAPVLESKIARCLGSVTLGLAHTRTKFASYKLPNSKSLR